MMKNQDMDIDYKDKSSSAYFYLHQISSPTDLKKLPAEAMPALAEELRSFLIENVSRTGGHLASNLGVVELSLALHRVFDAPKDHIIWDVGHQSYVHKILTGRQERFSTLRQPGGISGFTLRSESEYDCFGAGHSSTSLSAALGFAEADALNGSDAYTVAVVGDGAFTGGMIHEALNNCKKNLRLIIILNENEMSISKNIGLFAKNLSKIRTRPGYFKAKKVTGSIMKKIPLIGKPMFRATLRVKKAFKNIMYGSNYFEDLGLYYLGPADGNNYETVAAILAEAKKLNQSVVIHLKTKKGKGYAPAEKYPDQYHGIPKEGYVHEEPTLTDAFGHILTELANADHKICAVTAAMCDGTGLCEFREHHRNRFFDVGIAEEHAVTFGAGLAAAGMKPVVAIYSTFLQRAYDNILHDVALQALPVLLCIDRSGLNAKDGATHHGIFDVSFLSEIPGMQIYTPITVSALRRALRAALASGKPAAVRYGNFSEDERILRTFYQRETPEAPTVLCNFSPWDKVDAVIVVAGKIAGEALKAVDLLKEQGITAGVVLLEYLKPYDQLAVQVKAVLPPHVRCILFLEEEIRNGGMGMLLSDALRRVGGLTNVPMEILGVDDTFIVAEKGKSMYASAGIDAQTVAKRIAALI